MKDQDESLQSEELEDEGGPETGDLLALLTTKADEKGVDLNVPLVPGDVASGEAVESFEADLVPEMPVYDGDYTDGLDDAFTGLTLVDAYNLWVGKGTIDPRGRVESIKVRCPSPEHPDNNPSAWINTEKGEGGVGTCNQCGGFDKFTIYGWTHGLTPPGSKIGKEFPDLRRDMAGDLGWAVVESGGRTNIRKVDEPAAPENDDDDPDDDPGPGGGAPDPEPDPEPEPDEPVSLLGRLRETDPERTAAAGDIPDLPVVVSITGETITESEIAPQAFLDWENFITPGTYLDRYMEAVTQLTDIPHEYHLFNAMMALAAIMGRDVYLEEAVPVYPNLMTVLFGDTSSGKSRSMHPMMQVVQSVDPFDPKDDYQRSSGTKIVGSPGSGETLIKMFQDEVLDPSSNQVSEYGGHKGLAKIEEFSMAAAVGRRSGSTFREFLMSLYDTGSVSHASLASGTLRVDDAFMQVISTTQPDAVQEFLRRYDSFSGYLNRWIMVTGQNRMDRYLSQHPLPPDMTWTEEALAEIKRWVHRPAPAARRMRLEGDAFLLWDDFFQQVMKEMKENASPLLARWDLNLKKIILIMTANEMLETPTVEIVEKVIKNFFPYMRWVYQLFEAKMSTSEEERVLEDSLVYMERHYKRHGAWPTVRDMKKSSVARRYGAKLTIDTCEWAAKAGLIEKLTLRGKSSVRYGVVGF